MRPARAVAASLLVAAALAGCGDGDGEGETAPALGEQEFAARGDEICRSAAERVAEVQRDPPTSRQESVEFADRLIAIFEDEVARLEALDPPDEEQAAFDRYLDARAEAIGHLRDGLEAAEENDPEGYADAQAAAAEGRVERSELAQAAGLTECSGSVGAPNENAP